MSRLRMALAAASLLAGFAGAFAVLKVGADSGSTGRTAPRLVSQPHVTPESVGAGETASNTGGIVVALSRSRCAVDSRAKTVTFSVLLRNSRDATSPDLLVTWVEFSDSGGSFLPWNRRQISLKAAESRVVVLVVRYGPKRRNAKRCRISLAAEGFSPITMQRLS